MRATNELHEGSKEGLPLIKAKVTLGKEDLSVKVSLLFYMYKWHAFIALILNVLLFSS